MSKSSQNKTSNKEAITGAIQTLAPPLAASLASALEVFGIHVAPALVALLSSAYGLFGYFLYYQQDRLNNFVRWMKDNPDAFTEEMIGKQAFQQGFLATLEAYLRVRTEEKMRFVQRVFLGFVKNEDMERFELERFYEIIKIISADQIDALHIFDIEKSLMIFEGRSNITSHYCTADSYHELYQEIRSLESIGVILIYRSIDIVNPKRKGNPLRVTDITDSQHATSSPFSVIDEFAELTKFGEDFIGYLGRKAT